MELDIMKDLYFYTEKLLEEVNQCQDRFLSGEKPEKNREFFNAIRKEADETFNLLDGWVKQATVLVEQKEIKVLHLQQIEATKENVESLVLHSYYKDTRKRRFIEIYKSCYYIFAQVLKELEAK